MIDGNRNLPIFMAGGKLTTCFVTLTKTQLITTGMVKGLQKLIMKLIIYIAAKTLMGN